MEILIALGLACLSKRTVGNGSLCSKPSDGCAEIFASSVFSRVPIAARDAT